MNIRSKNINQVAYQFLLFFCLVLLSLDSFASKKVYVSSLKTVMYEQPNFSSKALMDLEKSTELEVLKQDGIWFQVKREEASGWITKNSVSKTFSLVKKISILTTINNLLTPNDRIERVNAIASYAGIRGLSDVDLKDTGKNGIKSLHELEEIKINSDELNSFIENTQERM